MTQIRTALVFIVGMLLATALNAGEPAEKTVVADVSLKEVRALLASRISVEEVIQRLGEPNSRSGGPHPDYINVVPTTLFYRLSGEKKYLWFRCLDEIVVAAHYAGTNVVGVGPVTHRLTVDFHHDGPKVWFGYSVSVPEREQFQTYDQLKAHLRSLPTSDIVTFMTNDTPSEHEPLTTQKEVDELKAFCKANAIRLIVEPGG